MTSHRQDGWRLLVKRLLDVSIAGSLLLVLWPLMLVVAAIVRAGIGSPVLYRQRRPGFRTRPFELIKFRTMTDAVDRDGIPLPDEQRLPSVGRMIRSMSLDELPQLLLVLSGDMSLVGPRPLLMRYLERYSSEQARRHDVLPGITGWAQVNGRNAISWDERFRLDLWYVDHWSLMLDLRILARTVGAIAGRRGISGQGSATMPEFMGPGSSDHE